MWTPEPMSEQELAEQAAQPPRGRQQYPCHVGVALSQESYDALRGYCFRHEMPIGVWLRQVVRRELKRALAAEEDE